MKTKKILAVVMAVVMVVLCFAACGKKETAKIVVSEKASVGENVVNSEAYFDGMTKTPVDTQQKALMEVKAGTADLAVIDYIMALGSTGEGSDFADLKINEDASFSPEYYGIAFRKNTDTAAVFDKAIAELYNEGKLQEIAAKYGLEKMLVKPSESEPTENTIAEWETIKAKGELVIGMTLFQPMDYYNDEGELVGFEVEFAKAVCEKLGIKAKFQEISWDAKETELNAKSIDCIWNGLSIDEDRKESMQLSMPYMENKQVVVSK